jgi:hypothetical protein
VELLVLLVLVLVLLVPLPLLPSVAAAATAAAASAVAGAAFDISLVVLLGSPPAGCVSPASLQFLLVLALLVLIALGLPLQFAWWRVSSQQPRNQPTPRRTKFGDGTFLAGVGVVLGVILGVLFAPPVAGASRAPWGYLLENLGEVAGLRRGAAAARSGLHFAAPWFLLLAGYENLTAPLFALSR